jgi:tRNA threonylcarbamoyladenosine biosynthesis protein TsaB
MSLELNKKLLFIDTSSNIEAAVVLKAGDREYKIVRKYDRNRSQIVLPMVRELLARAELQLTEVDAIDVMIGPGSFTGLRVGVAIANSLGYFLQIPINHNPSGKLVEPIYT